MSVQLPENQAIGPSCFGTELTEKRSEHRITLPKLETFTEKDLLFDATSSHYKTGYTSIYPFYKEGNGQLSLLLMETYFFCKYVPLHKPSDDTNTAKKPVNIKVIYAGAHPGDHILHLAIWFPHISFVLYDRVGDVTMAKLRGQVAARVQEAQAYFASNPNTVNETMKAQLTLSERVEFKQQYFSCSEAKQLNKDKESNTVFYLISDIRNSNYRRGNKPEFNSKILDMDMREQLAFAKELNPPFALMRYRPKLENERITISEELTNPNDVQEIRRLYFKYPNGRFLKVPMGKGDQSSMFIICNEYEPTVTYYHEDMLSMINHHNLNTRRVATYMNPLTSQYKGFINIKDVREIAAEANINLTGTQQAESAESGKDDQGMEMDSIALKYCCGMDWDHRAMIYIVGLYMRYSGIKLMPKDLKRLILVPYIEMEMNVSKVASTTMPEEEYF